MALTPKIARNKRLKSNRRHQSKPISHVETLEARVMLSTSGGSFAEFEGIIKNPHETDTFPVRLRGTDFVMPRDRVLLKLNVDSQNGLLPAAVEVVDRSGESESIHQRSSMGHSHTLAELSRGQYRLLVHGNQRTTGQYNLTASLVGDVDQNFIVDRHDLRSIATDAFASLRGERLRTMDSDVNHDGQVDDRDYQLARRNLGVSTSIRPFQMTVGIHPSNDPDEDGVVMRSSVLLRGKSGKEVFTRVRGVGGELDSTRSDSRGNFRLRVGLPSENNRFRVVSRDGFLQRGHVSLSVVRDSQGPTLGPGSEVVRRNNSVLLSGNVIDDLSGLKQLQVQIDVGGTIIVPVRANGDFEFDAALPLDGSADGSHTVTFEAIDRVGNRTQSELSFQLCAASSNCMITTDRGVQQMPSIAANPLDSNQLVVSYMDYSLVDTSYAGIGVGVSRDGGTTWQRTSIPVPAQFNEGAANPITRFDDQGNVFVSFMAATFLGEKPPLTNANFFNPSRGASDRDRGMQANNGVFVASSDDGGLTWNESVAVTSHLYDGDNDVPFEVIPDLAIDTFPVLPDGLPNPNFGNMYVAWSRLYPPGEFPGEPTAGGGGDIFIAVSEDGGQTWEEQTELRDGIERSVVQMFVDDFNSGIVAPAGLSFIDQAHLELGPQGEIYLSSIADGNFTVHLSTDGAASFVEPDDSAGQRTVFGTGSDSFANSDGLPNNSFRTHAVRSIVADPIRPGHVYAVEPILVLDALGNQIDGADVFFGRSTDFGESWETTLMVGPRPEDIAGLPNGTFVPLNDDNLVQSATGSSSDEVISGQAMARLTVDAKGDIGVIWYDTRRDPADHLLDVFGTISLDGGQTFSPNFRISDASFDADAGSFTNAVGDEEFYLGDFIGLAMSNNTAYAAWTDTRNDNQDIVFASYSIHPVPGPLNDRFEPNQTAMAATELGRVVQRVLPKLQVPPGDDDWFLLEAAATGELVATVTFDFLDASDLPSEPDALMLELRDQTGSTLLATGGDIFGLVPVVDENGFREELKVIGKELRLPGNAGQEFQVRVVGVGSESVLYSLKLQSLTDDLGTRAFVRADGSIKAGGGALYLVNAAAAGSIEVQLTSGVNVDGDLNLQILDPETFDVIASGEAPPAPFITATSAEPNDSIGQANPTGLNGPGSVTIDSFTGDGAFGATSGDYDFFSFDAAANHGITVEVNVTEIGSNLDSLIILYDSSGQVLEVVDGAGSGSNEILTFSTDKADTYSVAVLDWQSFPASDPFTPGTGAGAGAPLGAFRLTITSEAVGPGAIAQASLPSRQGEPVFILVTGAEESSGDFTLDFTNLDQFVTPENETLFFPLGGGPSQAAMSDLNGDGNLDVAVANALSDTVSVLLGSGDGTFQTPRRHPIGAFVLPESDVSARLPTFGRDLAITTFDADNVPDIVVTNFGSSDVSVLLGRGDGTFDPHRRFDATPAPYDLDVADLNGDGLSDVVSIETANALEVSVAALLGRGDGTFAVGRITPVPISGNNNGTLLSADLNGDGNVDLIVSADAVLPQISVLLGNGDGTFNHAGDFPAGRLSVALDLFDLDEDGHLDLVSADFGELPNVSVLFGNGDGTFQAPRQFFNGQSATALRVIDVGSQMTLSDGSISLGPPDGNPDVVVTNSGVALAVSPVGGPEVVVLPGLFDEDGQFLGLGSPIQLVEAIAPQDLDVGDVNNDNAMDLVVVDRDGILVIYGQPLNIVANSTVETARDLGTVVHLVDQTQTIVPGREDAFYKLTVPTELTTAADEIIDVSLLFQHQEGPGLNAELRDEQGNLIGSGERIRARVKQGEELLLHVFGVENGTTGFGAFTPVINILPQVVSLEAQALLPGTNGNPGGPTTSIVVTLQGDRLDPTEAEKAENYEVTFLGDDGQNGTADDQIIPISCGSIDAKCVVYNPSSNVDISTGFTYPTAVRQTVTLLFETALPSGSYSVELSPNIQTVAFTETESSLLSDDETIFGHPVVSVNGQISQGSKVSAIDLVLESGATGDFSEFKTGTAFLTQLHDNLGAELDQLLTELGDDPSITTSLANLVIASLNPSLGSIGQRSISLAVFILDPVSIDLVNPGDGQIELDLETKEVTNGTQSCYVEVGGNVQIIVCPIFFTGSFTLTVDDVPETGRGAAIIMDNEGNDVTELTDDLRMGDREFEIGT